MAQLLDASRAQQGHQGAHVLSPRAQLPPEHVGPVSHQGAQEMPRDTDGPGTQRERPHDVEGGAYPAGGQHRQTDGVVTTQRLQEAQHRRLPPAGQVGVVAVGAPLVLDGDEVRAARPGHVDGVDTSLREGRDRPP